MFRCAAFGLAHTLSSHVSLNFETTELGHATSEIKKIDHNEIFTEAEKEMIVAAQQ